MTVPASRLSAYRSESGSSSATRHRPCFLSHQADHRGWSVRKEETREASPGGGRTAMCNSPAQSGPGDAPAGVPVDAPFSGAGDRGHDIEAVRPAVVARPVPPRASGVLHLDPEAVRADFGAQGDRAAIAGGAVQDGVG